MPEDFYTGNKSEDHLPVMGRAQVLSIRHLALTKRRAVGYDRRQAAHDYLESNANAGKVVLKVS